MPTLTPEQISDLRGDSGDVGSSPEVSTIDLQRFYDKAYALGNDEDVTYATTMVYIIRRQIGLAIKKIDVRGEVEAESRSQIIKNLRDSLKDWEMRAGMTGGIGGMIQVGTLNLGIDYTDEDYEAEWDS